MKNNSAPGLDGIATELLKYGTEDAIDAVTDLIVEVFNTNEIPSSWLSTIQIPIPKTRGPQSTNDYRRITLCSTAYKIYARILLDRLERQLPPLPAYQMAFQAKRSAADQIFVLRRVLDERWRKGAPTIIVSLDLKQAFDRINTTKTAAILMTMGVSKALINRIIKACLTEETSVQWFGQRTQSIRKTKGIKQGCPLSPIIFIIMLHSVLTTLREFLPELNIEQLASIALPLVLAYADDLLFLCTRMEDVERIISTLEPLLASIGLEINTDKSKVLFRDPFNTKNVAPEEIQTFGKYKLPVVTKIRYLGAYITSSLTRKETTRERIRKAYSAFYSLTSFLRDHSIRWATIKKTVPYANHSNSNVLDGSSDCPQKQ